MARVELHPPLVLPGDVRASLATVIELDVVVHHAAIDDRAGLLLLVESAVPLAAGDVLVAGDEMQRLERAEEVAGKPDRRRRAGIAGAGPRRGPLIAPPGEVRAGVVGGRQGRRFSRGVSAQNPVADQPAVPLVRARHAEAEDAVPRAGVALPAVVAQRQVDPLRGELGIGPADVSARRDRLDLEDGAARARRQRRRDEHPFSRPRRGRLMPHGRPPLRLPPSFRRLGTRRQREGDREQGGDQQSRLHGSLPESGGMP